jgi:hypothetical protein
MSQHPTPDVAGLVARYAQQLDPIGRGTYTGPERRATPRDPAELGLRLIDWARQCDELATLIRDYHSEHGVPVKLTEDLAGEFSVKR